MDIVGLIGVTGLRIPWLTRLTLLPGLKIGLRTLTVGVVGLKKWFGGYMMPFQSPQG